MARQSRKITRVVCGNVYQAYDGAAIVTEIENGMATYVYLADEDDYTERHAKVTSIKKYWKHPKENKQVAVREEDETYYPDADDDGLKVSVASMEMLNCVSYNIMLWSIAGVAIFGTMAMVIGIFKKCAW